MLGEQTGALQPAEGALIRLGGDVHSPRELSVSDLWSLSRHECEVEFSCRKRGPRRHRFIPALLGLTRDGDALDAEGPQLVVPGDRVRGAACQRGG